MSGIVQTLQTPPPVSVQTLLYGIYQAASNGGGGGGGSTAWGSITGTLSNQTDLQSALNAKLTASNNLSDLTNAGTARTNLGLGTIATQAASAVAITGGTATGLTGLGIRSTGAAFDLTLATSEALSAGRTLSFNVGNADRTLTIPATGTVALLGTAQTFSAANIFSANGAASTPPLSLTGTWFTGGTATTTKPQLLIEPAGTTTTNWSTSGTGLGINAPSGFAGNLLNFQVNGNALIYNLAVRTFTIANFDPIEFVFGDSISLLGATNSNNRFLFLSPPGLGRKSMAFGLGQFYNGNTISFSSSQTDVITNADTWFIRKAAATLQMGLDAAGVTNQMFTAANRITSDGVGANLTIAPGNGRGAAGGSLILSTFTTAGASTAGTLTTRLTLDTSGLLTFADAVNMAFNTTTGTKIGTATGQKIGFWNATPVVQQILATGAGATVDNVISLLQTLGLCKQS